MNGENAYMLANASVAPFWLCMMLAPRAALTRRFVASPLVPLVYAAVYTVMIATTLVSPAGGTMSSMAGLRVSFESDFVLLMAWTHYLCFDMLIGMWEVRDSERYGLSPWRLAPCLALTLMAGPAGFLAYVAVRWFHTRELALS